MGRNVKFIAPHYVKHFVNVNKNDYNHAAAIAEVVKRPGMGFVPIKSVEQREKPGVRDLGILRKIAVQNHLLLEPDF